MQKGKKYKNHSIILIVILLISFLINIFVYIDNIEYKHRAGVNSYKNIESIKVKNDKTLEIVNKAVEVNKISNEELLTLYTNYSDISDCVIELWDDYKFYSENDSNSLFKKKIDTSSIIENEVYSRIESYLSNTLINIMNTEKNELFLKEKDLRDFIVMKDLSTKMNDIFLEFNETTLNGIDGKEKEKVVVKKKYWIDVLNKINRTSSEYIDYDFTRDVSVSKVIY